MEVEYESITIEFDRNEDGVLSEQEEKLAHKTIGRQKRQEEKNHKALYDLNQDGQFSKEERQKKKLGERSKKTRSEGLRKDYLEHVGKNTWEESTQEKKSFLEYIRTEVAIEQRFVSSNDSGVEQTIRQRKASLEVFRADREEQDLIYKEGFSKKADSFLARLKDAEVLREDLQMFEDETGQCKEQCRKDWSNHFKIERNYEKEQRARLRQKTDNKGEIEGEFRNLKDSYGSKLKGKKGKSRKNQYKELRKFR